MPSVTQKACQTPAAPQNRLKIKAAGIISRTYRSSDIVSDGPPIPSPSSAPEAMTETAETINPRLMIRRASLPAATVSGF